MKPTEAGTETVTERRTVEHSSPEGLEVNVEQVIQISHDFLKGGFFVGVEDEGRVHGLSWQQRNILGLLHMRLVHELLFCQHCFFLGHGFFLNLFVLPFLTHQLLFVKDL